MHRKTESDMFPLDIKGKNVEEFKEGQKCRNSNYGIRKNGSDG